MEAAATEATSASPDTTASQSQPQSIFMLPSTNTILGRTGSALTARASAHSEARRMLSRSMRSTVPKATATSAVAQIFAHSFSRSSRVELFEVVEPARDARGIEHHRRRHHRAGERSPARLVAAGHRPDAAHKPAPLAPKGRTQHRLFQRQAGGGFRDARHGSMSARRVCPSQSRRAPCGWKRIIRPAYCCGV